MSGRAAGAEEIDPPEEHHDLSAKILHRCGARHTWVEHEGPTVSITPGGPRTAVAKPAVCPECSKPAATSRQFRLRLAPFDESYWCAWWVRRRGGTWRLTFHQGRRSTGWESFYDCIEVHTGEQLEVDWTWDVRKAELTEYPRQLQERWWRTSDGELIGNWSQLAPGLDGYLIKGEDVEKWVREAQDEGLADGSGQLLLPF